jgi:hypothetical protein
MKHKKLNAIIISVIATIAIVVTICLMVAYRSEITQYSINYYEGNIVYYIDAKPNHILVEKRTVINCIKAPCEPIKESERRIDYTPEYRQAFENIFAHRGKTAISTSSGKADSDLGEENARIIRQLIYRY